MFDRKYLFSYKPYIFEISALLVMCQNFVTQSGCRILRLSLSLEEMRGYIFDFLQGYINEGKVVSKVTTSGWACPGTSNHTQTYLYVQRVLVDSFGGIDSN